MHFCAWTPLLMRRDSFIWREGPPSRSETDTAANLVHYCTLSLSDLWVTRQDNQNKTQMVNTKIIYNLREHRRKRETIYENTEEKSTMIVWSYFQLCLWMCLGPLQSRESPPPPQNLTKLSILDLNRKPRGRYHLFIFGEGPTVFIGPRYSWSDLLVRSL